MPISQSFLTELKAKPLFCFTSDMDWAEDDMIAHAFSIFDQYEVPVTPFLTNRSEFLDRRFSKFEDRIGLHPNFLAGSSHGRNVNEVCEHVISLNPASRFFRCHQFYDVSEVTQAFSDRGFSFDFNLYLPGEPNLQPFVHESGLIRYPVFLGDGTLLEKFPDGDLSELLELVMTPGLKIFNFHPVHVCLNAPSLEYYRQFRTQKCNWRYFVHKGDGIRTSLFRLLDTVRRRPSMGIYSLSDLHQLIETNAPKKMAVRAAKSDAVTTPAVPSPVSADDYDKLDNEQRAAFKRGAFNQLATKGIYGTSRDFNLRELEIDFIIKSIQQHTAGLGRTPRVVDLGCGNGYTTLRIAESQPVNMLGVDFAEALVAEALELSKSFNGSGNPMPRFQTGDITKIDFERGAFDVAVTERVLLNLVDQVAQQAMLKKIHQLLAPHGIYVMVEGNSDGLQRLNSVRQDLGLQPIPDRGFDNVGALKFREADFDSMIDGLFATVDKRSFGTYFLISRVVHPLLVAPNTPAFDHKINAIARNIESRCPDVFNGGHLLARVLRKI